MSNMDHKNWEYCKRVAEEVEAYANGNVYQDEEGEVHDMSDAEPGSIPDDWEQLSLYDWASDVLDCRYIVNSDGSYNSARFSVALGGPNVYVDTEDCAVELYWACDHAEYGLDTDVISELDDIGEELYESVRA